MCSLYVSRLSRWSPRYFTEGEKFMLSDFILMDLGVFRLSVNNMASVLVVLTLIFHFVRL